jgi:5-methylcytosine-specific restriction endonuclease McrA
MGDDVTVEHLLPRCDGGTNRFDNLVLAHHRCNTMADSLPLALKLLLREHLRHGGLPGVTSLLFS